MDSSKVIGYINPSEFTACVKKLRAFFDAKGFLEVHTQNRMSILAACEDPNTIATYNYSGQVWPLSQTGQMWLEYELLKNPEAKGFYCVSTSYRNEPTPVPGRHDLIFPMFEYEMKGTMEDMVVVQKELLNHLGFDKFYSGAYPEDDYENVAEKYGTHELEHEHETQLKEDHGPVFFLKNFPNHTSPFWNMRQDTALGQAKKVDVILNGMETIGSAERSCSPDEMRHMFYTISNGDYARRLFALFTKERVEKELNEFLSFKFFDRSGGGIGVTRMIKALKEHDLLFDDTTTTTTQQEDQVQHV